MLSRASLLRLLGFLGSQRHPFILYVKSWEAGPGQGRPHPEERNRMGAVFRVAEEEGMLSMF